jgi:hypothetical protein
MPVFAGRRWLMFPSVRFGGAGARSPSARSCTTLSPGDAGFFRSELMCSALLMGGLAALAGNFPLFLFVHRRKSALISHNPAPFV